ncbi:MAG: CobW/HypB/UreG, nucleotide-binding domain [Candidatus Parcubacteria bacterium]
MKILVITGALGAGKTTLVLSILTALQASGIDTKTRIAYVLNDAGLLVDGQVASDRAQVIAMTNGCFTCESPQELRDGLARLNAGGIEWVIMEGFGGIAGNETRLFLESVPYPFHIFTVLSYQHHRQDLHCYADVLKSQVRAATLGIGITKCPPDASLLGLMGTGDLDQIMDFVSVNNSGAYTTTLRQDEPPQIITDLFQISGVVLPGVQSLTPWITSHLMRLVGRCNGHCHSCGNDHGHKHDHACGHHHEHDSVHGTFFPYSFALKPDTTLEEIQLACSNKDFLLRVKGAVQGNGFNCVHSTWTIGGDDDRLFVTFYSSKRIDVVTDLPLLSTLIAPTQSPDSSHEDPGYLQSRKETGTPEETVALLQQMLQELPTELVLVQSPGSVKLRLLTHPETMQRLKDGIARRPSVKDEWFPIVLKHCMEYWVKCVRYLQDHADTLEPGDIARHKRELTGSMVWWTNRFTEAFGDELVATVNSLGLGTLAAEGALALTALNSEEDRAKWECDEITEALLHGITHGENRECILEAARHCLSLADTDTKRVSWDASVKMLTDTQPPLA